MAGPIATVDDNRRFDYGQYPGDLFQEIQVIKTPSADLINFGLAGSVNLQTYDPLTQKDTFAVNVQGEVGQYGKLNPDGSNKGYKASAIWMHKFADDTLGVSLGVSAIKDPTQDYHWATGGGNGNYYGPTSPDPLGNIGPDDIQNYVNSNTLYRQSGFGHIVYRPTAGSRCPSTRSIPKARSTNCRAAGKCRWRAGVATARSRHRTVIERLCDVRAVERLSCPSQRLNTSAATTFALGANTKYDITDNIKFVLDGNIRGRTPR